MARRASASSCAIRHRRVVRSWPSASTVTYCASRLRVPFMPDESSMPRRAPDVVERVTGFCRMLRERGLRVTPAESVDAVRAVGLVDLVDRLALHLALRGPLTARRGAVVLVVALY